MRSGDTREVGDASEVFAALREVVDDAQRSFAVDQIEIFGLRQDGTPGPNTLGPMTWRLNHSAAHMRARFGNAHALLEIQEGSFYTDMAVIGRQEGTRYLALASNPFRDALLDGNNLNESMHEFMRRSFAWLTQRDDLTRGAFNVVLAHEPQQRNFQDQTANRRWLDREFPNSVQYNSPGSCDGRALGQCVNDSTDLLIITSYPSPAHSTADIVAGVQSAMDRGIPVVYMNFNGDGPQLAHALLDLFHVDQTGKNFNRRLNLIDAEARNPFSSAPLFVTNLMNMLERLETNTFSFDLGACSGGKCPDESRYSPEFLSIAEDARSLIQSRDQSQKSLFNGDGSTEPLTKLLVILGDVLRRDVNFPMDKNTTPAREFLASLLADKLVFSRRAFAEQQADLGNFSSADFSTVAAIAKRVQMVSKPPFRAAGVYAMPGRSFSVTRRDNTAVAVDIFINTQRDGATKEFNNNGYSRPKHLRSPDYRLRPGETLTLTSPQGGTIQVAFNTSGANIDLDFSGVGQHPYWASPADNDSFAAALDEGIFNWAEISTEGFEAHTRRDKILTTLERTLYAGSPARLAAATERYMNNYAHVAAGFKGPGIEAVPEIHDWAAAHALAIANVDIVKHMNSDQAACGAGCSGNPYDASWPYDPLNHGDLHELGHGLQSRRIRFTGWGGEPRANYYSYYAQSRYFAETNANADTRSCNNKIQWEEMFDVLQASRNTPNPSQYVEEQGLNAGPQVVGILVQMMMSAENEGTLENGWHLLARLHILDREFDSATANETT